MASARGRTAVLWLVVAVGALAIAGCGGGSSNAPDPAVVTYNSLLEALSREVPAVSEGHLEKLACGSEIEELEASTVEDLGGVEGGCTGYFANPLGNVSIPYNVTINPDWCFKMEVPYESITGIDEGGDAPEIESEGIAESQGAQAAGGVLGNVDGCVHPKPEG